MIQFKQGDKVILTEAGVQGMQNWINSSVTAANSQSWVNTGKSVMGLVGTVGIAFNNGYKPNVHWDIPYERHDGTFQDQTILQLHANWLIRAE